MNWMTAGSASSESVPGAAAALVGLRRVDWVRLLVDDDHVGAEGVGVGYRLPTTCPISMSVATRLIASGVPHVTRHLGTRVADRLAGQLELIRQLGEVHYQTQQIHD